MDIFKILQQAQQVQGRMEQMQEELAKLTINGTAGGGMVNAEVDGKGAIKRVRIDPSVAGGADVEMLEDLIVVAVQDAQKKAADAAREAAQAEMGRLTGGMNLPFPFKLPL